MWKWCFVLEWIQAAVSTIDDIASKQAIPFIDMAVDGVKLYPKSGCGGVFCCWRVKHGVSSCAFGEVVNDLFFCWLLEIAEDVAVVASKLGNS